MRATNTGNIRWSICVSALSAGLTLAACGAAGLGGGANGAGSSATPSASASPPPTPTASPTSPGDVTVAMLTRMAEQSAKSDGDPNVRVADAVLTTRQAAVTLTSGSLVNSNEAVYLVQMIGHFTLNDVPIPPNSKAPTGTALSFDVDVSDGQTVDLGLAHKAADLSKLGPVIVLTL